MIDYTGIECPVCHKQFEENDDIVVCPKCGAPYHRDCYQKVGHCLFSDKHGTDQAWKPPKTTDAYKTAEQANEEKDKICPRCGRKNFRDALFCDKCGMPFSEKNASPFFGSTSSQGPMDGFPLTPFIMDPMGGVNPAEKIDGVTAGDIAKYVQTNTPYYLPVFKKIKDYNKGRFNFCAFLFTGGWLLYRKQYKIGTIFTVIVALLSICSTFISHTYSAPILNSLISASKLDPTTASIPMVANLIAQSLPTLPWQDSLLLMAPFIMSFISWIIMFFTGFLGNRMYFKHCIKKVKSIQETTTSQTQYHKELQQKGGVNMQLGFCLMICYMIINLLPQFLL